MHILINQSVGALHRSGGVNSTHIEQIKKVEKQSLTSGEDKQSLKSGDYKQISVTVADEGSAEFSKELLEADVLISSRLIDFDLSEAPNLKWIHVTSAGVNNLSSTIRESEIMVTNSSGVHPIPISEHVLGLMLMLSRGIDTAFRNQITKKKWIRDSSIFRSEELCGKVLLVVGMGRIGERVAMLGKAFEMEVFGIVRNPEKHKDSGVEVFSMEELEKQLSTADFVVNALPLTDETKGMFDKKLFNKFKDDSIFINIGRGDTVVEKDLIEILESGKLGKAGLDVTEVEPLPDSSPLWNMENVIITPHISGLNPYYTDRMIGIFIENLKAFIAKKVMPNLVDKELGY
jgi:D-2-hydroxyacid dehydrogenase (NADP+)